MNTSLGALALLSVPSVLHAQAPSEVSCSVDGCVEPEHRRVPYSAGWSVPQASRATRQTPSLSRW